MVMALSGLPSISQLRRSDGSSQATFDDIATVTADLHIKATLTDHDGDSTHAVSPVALLIQFQDDGPLAVNDVNAVTGSLTFCTGNVITANDVGGTDGAKITEISGVATSTAPDGLHNFTVSGQHRHRTKMAPTPIRSTARPSSATTYSRIR